MQKSLAVVAPVAGAPVRPKRKILVDLLCLCIERSQLVKVLSVDTVRYVIESALGQIYREGEFRLEPLWAILSKEPGLTAEMSAAPLLAFKGLEEQINLRIRLPADVIGMQPTRAAELQRAVDLPSERVAALVDELRSAEAASASDAEARREFVTGNFKLGRTSGARPALKPQTARNQIVTGPAPKVKPAKAPTPRSRLILLGALLIVLVLVIYFVAVR